MKAVKGRFVLCLVVFLAWLGYLGYLVAERAQEGAVILSRPQFLVSDLDVIATARSGSDTVTISEVLYPDTAAARQLTSQSIHVSNLDQCRLPGDRTKTVPDLQAEGPYLLALQNPGPDEKDYRVAVTPPSPGFPRGTPRAYPATRGVVAQYRQIQKN